MSRTALPHLYSGKVRELYEVGHDRLLIVASDRAEWRLPQVALGILPNHGGIVRLARWVGKGQAMKVAMGYPMKAEEAFHFGLAQWLVPHAELIAQTTSIAERRRARSA